MMGEATLRRGRRGTVSTMGANVSPNSCTNAYLNAHDCRRFPVCKFIVIVARELEGKILTFVWQVGSRWWARPRESA